MQWTVWNKWKQGTSEAPSLHIYTEHILWTCDALLSLCCIELWKEIKCTLIWKILNFNIRLYCLFRLHLETLKICIRMSIAHSRMRIQTKIILNQKGFLNCRYYRLIKLTLWMEAIWYSYTVKLNSEWNWIFLGSRASSLQLTPSLCEKSHQLVHL